MYINEEEVSRMHGKMSLLSACCDIKDLGYRYDEDECIIIDLFADEGGYGGPSEYEIITSIIKPTIGDGFVESNSDNIEKLKEIGAKIPTYTHTVEDVIGALFLISNEHTLKVAKYGLQINEEIKSRVKSLNDAMFFDESTVDEIQVFFNKEGMYIVCPEEYLCVEEFLNNYTRLLQIIIEQVAEVERTMNLKEVA